MTNKCLIFYCILLFGVITQAKNPNIVLILVDDLDMVVSEQFYDEILPFTMSLKDEGVYYKNAFITTPTCCPSRSSLLTGRYSHNTGVYANRGETGGHKMFVDDEMDTLPVRLLENGYKTFITGKYLNGFRAYSKPKKKKKSATPPPGWSEGSIVASPKSGNNYKGYKHTLLNWKNGEFDENQNWNTTDNSIVDYGKKPEDYSTDVLFKKTLDFLKDAKEENDDQPFFTYVAPACPHTPIPPAERHKEKARERWSYDSLPKDRPNYGKNFDQKTHARWLHNSIWSKLQSKIAGLGLVLFGADNPPGSPLLAKGWNEVDFYNRMGSMYACDEGVESVVTWLKDNDEWENTVFIFMSDNGYMLGAHNLSQKTVPYEESIRVPMLIAGGSPLITRKNEVDENWVLNIDLYPTFLDFIGIDTEKDGLSFADTLTDPNFQLRDSFLMEYLGSLGKKKLKKFQFKLRSQIPYFRAVRRDIFREDTQAMHTFVYIEWEQYKKKLKKLIPWEVEIYDVTADPYQTVNLYKTDFRTRNLGLIEEFHNEVDALSTCVGSECHIPNYNLLAH